VSFSYRTTDLAKWGVGLLRKLHAVEIDLNWWSAEQRLATLESAPAPPPAIDHFESIGTSFYVHFVDLSVMGPYALPVAKYNKRGQWAPFTHYSVLDTFIENGATYETLLDHDSAATFDANATDGSGHDLYSPMFESPGNSLPTGGAVGMVMSKSATADFAVTWSWKFPEGGTTGKFLRQASNTQDDTEWATPDATEIGFTPVTGSSISSSTVAGALEELASGGAVEANHVSYTPGTGTGLTSSNVAAALDELGARGSASGKQTIWVPAAGMTPLITDGAAPNTIETSTTKTVIKTLDFDATTAEAAQFEVAMPKSWDKGDVSFRVFWSHAATTVDFDVSWTIYAVAIGPNTSGFDEDVGGHAGFISTGGVTDTLYVTDLSDPLTVLDATSGLTPSDNSIVIFRVERSSPSTADTMAIDARLHGIQVVYTASAATDD